MAGVLELDDLLSPFRLKSWFSYTNSIVKGFITKLSIVIWSRNSHYMNLIKSITLPSVYFSSKGRRCERSRRQGYSSMQNMLFWISQVLQEGYPWNPWNSWQQTAFTPSSSTDTQHSTRKTCHGQKSPEKPIKPVGIRWVHSSNLLSLNYNKIWGGGVSPDLRLVAPKKLKLPFTRRETVVHLGF